MCTSIPYVRFEYNSTHFPVCHPSTWPDSRCCVYNATIRFLDPRVQRALRTAPFSKTCIPIHNIYHFNSLHPYLQSPLSPLNYPRPMEPLQGRLPHLNIPDNITLESVTHSGFGSYGDVYRAELLRTHDNGSKEHDNWHSSSKFVALKRFRLHSGISGKSVEEGFVREFSIWAGLRHKNILPLLGYCTYRDEPAIVSPWMETGTILQYWVKNSNTPDARSLLEIVSDGIVVDNILKNFCHRLPI